MTIHSTQAKNQRGFTIIELMIATTVFSVILLLVTTMMIGIGNLFYKGINQARVQDSVRNITDEVSQQLQLSGTPPPPPGTDSEFGPAISVYCVGQTRYSYIENVQMGHTRGVWTLNHVLWRDTPSTCDGTKAANLTDSNLDSTDSGGAELVPANSRLTDFSLGTSSPFTVSVGIAYGDDDLICDTGSAGDCDVSGVSAHISQIVAGTTNPIGQIQCKSNIGDQFCAAASLTTTVANRL